MTAQNPVLDFGKEVLVAQDPSLLDLLACPKCHGALARIERPAGFACQACKLFFAEDDGLPNLLIEEAKPWPLQSASQS